MARCKRKPVRHAKALKRGRGVVSTVLNRAIDLLPVELHLPGYQYCGPGTKLKERLARGDKGINGLDSACKDHDIAYSRYKDSERRRQADKVLAESAWKRFKAADSSLGEKTAALAVSTAMRVKSKIGGGRRKKRGVKRLKGKGLYLRPYKVEGGGKRKKKRTCKKKKTSQYR